MIHHIQHLEDRLGDIPGTDTTSSDHLTKLEKEANLRGTMTFRNWTDSILNEDIKKINYINPNFKDEWEEAIRYPEFKEMGIKSWIEIANKGYVTNYSKIKDKLGNVDLKFDSLEEPKKQRFQNALNKGNIEMPIAVKFSDNDYDLVAGNTRISGLVKNKIDPKIWVVDLSNNLNEAVVGDKIECDGCGWSWNIVDGGNDLFICHKCGHNNEPISEGKKKDPFGLLAYAQELGRLREDESEYKVYLDMDGVLADFNQRFRDLSGMEPSEFESKYGRKAFWNLIDEEHKIKFWVGIKPMDGASSLVDAVKDYDYELLTSPSAKKQSYLGKILWVKNHTGDVFPSKPRINFKKAKEKHLIKPQLAKTDILIDDREDTIGRWNAAGGTGIVYKSIGQTLNDLKKLGL
jgi:PAS domain-containing protein